VAGAELDVIALDITNRDDVFTRTGNIFTTRGVAFGAGLVYKPNWQPYRLGVAVRAPVNTPIDSNAEHVDEDVILGDPSAPDAIWLPRAIRRPWSVDAGIAVSLGERPLNPRFIDPIDRLQELEAFLERRAERRAREPGPENAAARDVLDEEHLARARRELRQRLLARYRALSRHYVLLSAALRADGEVIDSVGVESFLQGYVDRSGEAVTFSPRLGIELEPLVQRMKLRAGSYAEPSRFRAGTTRLHATLGGDLKLFESGVFGLYDEQTAWRASGALDVSRDYFSWGVSVGTWW
jgi:hypothetical protein